MRKLLFGLPIVGILLIIGCGEEPTGPDTAPTVTAKEAIKNGAALTIEWTALSGVDGYRIYVNGVAETTMTSTAADVYGPAKIIEVCGYRGDKEGPKGSLDLTPVVKDITVYGASDPSSDHHSGFGFATDGTAITYPLSGPDTLTNWPKIDFYLEDRGCIPMSLFSPTAVPTGAFPYHKLNDEENTSVEFATITDFDEADSAYALGSYSTQTQLKIGAVYSFWIDPNHNNWDNHDDHFGKIKVLSISGTKVDLKVAYQKVPGYRMLKTK